MAREQQQATTIAELPAPVTVNFAIVLTVPAPWLIAAQAHARTIQRESAVTLSMAAYLSTALLHHTKVSWKRLDKNLRYYSCDDPAWDVVYFGEGDSTIVKSLLRPEAATAAAQVSQRQIW